MDRMAQDYNKAVATAAAAAQESQNTIELLETKAAAAQQQLQDTEAEMHRQLAIATSQVQTEGEEGVSAQQKQQLQQEVSFLFFVVSTGATRVYNRLLGTNRCAAVGSLGRFQNVGS